MEHTRREIMVIGFNRSLLGPKMEANRVLDQVDTVRMNQGSDPCVIGQEEERNATV